MVSFRRLPRLGVISSVKTIFLSLCDDGGPVVSFRRLPRLGGISSVKDNFSVLVRRWCASVQLSPPSTSRSYLVCQRQFFCPCATMVAQWSAFGRLPRLGGISSVKDNFQSLCDDGGPVVSFLIVFSVDMFREAVNVRNRFGDLFRHECNVF